MAYVISVEKNPLVVMGVQTLIGKTFPRIEVGSPGNREEKKVGPFQIFEFRGPAVPTHLAVDSDATILGVDQHTGTVFFTSQPPHITQELSLQVAFKPFPNLQAPQLRFPDASMSVKRPESIEGQSVLCFGPEGQVYNARDNRYIRATNAVALVGCVGKTSLQKQPDFDPNFGAIVLIQPAGNK